MVPGTESLRLLASALLSLAVLTAPETAAGSGTVGGGTPASCTEAVFDTALFGGGPVTFDCGGGAVSVGTVSGGNIGVWDLGGVVTLTNCTITGGAAIGVTGRPTLTNTIVAGNPGGDYKSGCPTDGGLNPDNGTVIGPKQ